MATKNIIPRNDDEGQIGTSSKKWASAHISDGVFDTLMVAGNSVSGGGSPDSISAGNSSVAVTDTGTNGTIMFKTEGANKWEITSAGHLYPVGNGTLDIGSANRKVRDLYVDDNSIKFVDDSNAVKALSRSGNDLQWDSKALSTKEYVDSVAQGLDVQPSVRLRLTSISNWGGEYHNGRTRQGVTLATGDRVLTESSFPSESGIFIIQDSGAPVRASNFNTGKEAAGAFVFVEEGTFADKGFVCTNNSGSDVVGTNGLSFTQFSSTTTGFLNNLVEDTTPELGGDLDLGSHQIVTSGSDSIILNSNSGIYLESASSITLEHHDLSHASVDIKSSGNFYPGKIKFWNHNNSYTVSIAASTSSDFNSNYTLTLPVNNGSLNQVLKTDGNGNLSWVDQPTGGSGGGLTYDGSQSTSFIAVVNKHYSVSGSSQDVIATLPTSGSGQISFKNMNASYNLKVQVTQSLSPAKKLDGVDDGHIDLDYKEAVTLITDGSGNWEII